MPDNLSHPTQCAPKPDQTSLTLAHSQADSVHHQVTPLDRMNILIAGGGIGGLTAALCLAKAGHQVQVFEQASEFGEIGAGIQLSPNCTHVLHYLGLAPALQAKAFLPQGVEFRHWRSGKVISTSELGDSVVQRFGSPYYHMHRGDLLTTLVTAAAAHDNIKLSTNSRITKLTQTAETASLVINEREHIGDAVIGADGIHSAVRESLWGRQEPTFTGNVAWRAMVKTSDLPENLIRPMSTAWWGPHKHFVHYYVRGGEFVNCVCVVEKDTWLGESWTDPGEYQELKSDFAGWHSDIQTLIDTADRSSLFKWGLFDRPPMPQWGQGRATLLGDACHPTLPFMAQGAAMAIEDAAVLAACLKDPATVTTDLQRYENLRRERTAGIQNGSRRNAKVFHLKGIAAWLRNRAVGKAGSNTTDRLYSYNPLTVVE